MVEYRCGLGNFLSTEGLSGALPAHNSPQRCPYGLYAEQLSGTPFTAPRAFNRRSWLYRIRPGLTHGAFEQIDDGQISADFASTVTPPNQLRWDPLPMPGSPTDFIGGLTT